MGKLFVILLLVIAAIGIYAWLSGGALGRIQAELEQEENPVREYFISQLGKPVSYSPEGLAPATPSVSSVRIEESPSERDIEEAKQFGDPSPSRGSIYFEPVYVYSYGEGSRPKQEYVTLRAKGSNTEKTTLTGWSLQSAVSGVRAYIGNGTLTYRLGEGASLAPIALAPGASATIVSGASPIGTSFRTNVCSGYLEQFQDFTPSLSLSCPSPSTELPNTLDNLRTYGASCVDFVKTLPSCTYHLGTFPEGLTPECRNFVGGALTYNSCVVRHEFESGFSSGSWRIYLGSQRELWNDSHDVIRLLDASGRTVDVWSY